MTGTSAEAGPSLVAAAVAGDEWAFRRLVEPYRRQLMVHCYRMLGSLDDADDAVQETLLKAWRGLADFTGRSSLRTWLYRIATNVCLDALDHRARRILPTAVAAPADPRVPPDPDEPDLPWLEPYPDGLLDIAEADLVAWYVQAWHSKDVPALVALLREDAHMAMPPTPSWYTGRDSIGLYLRQLFTSPWGLDLRLLSTAANRQPAFGVYTPAEHGDGYRPFALQLLTIHKGPIGAITGFVHPGLFDRFGLPDRLPAGRFTISSTERSHTTS